MAIMTSEAEDELGGYWLHTTLAQGAASGMFQGEGTTRKKILLQQLEVAFLCWQVERPFPEEEAHKEIWKEYC